MYMWGNALINFNHFFLFNSLPFVYSDSFLLGTICSMQRLHVAPFPRPLSRNVFDDILVKSSNNHFVSLDPVSCIFHQMSWSLPLRRYTPSDNSCLLLLLSEIYSKMISNRTKFLQIFIFFVSTKNFSYKIYVCRRFFHLIKIKYLARTIKCHSKINLFLNENKCNDCCLPDQKYILW